MPSRGGRPQGGRGRRFHPAGEQGGQAGTSLLRGHVARPQPLLRPLRTRSPPDRPRPHGPHMQAEVSRLLHLGGFCITLTFRLASSPNSLPHTPSLPAAGCAAHAAGGGGAARHHHQGRRGARQVHPHLLAHRVTLHRAQRVAVRGTRRAHRSWPHGEEGGGRGRGGTRRVRKQGR